MIILLAKISNFLKLNFLYEKMKSYFIRKKVIFIENTF
jgi:hypothetical protein